MPRLIGIDGLNNFRIELHKNREWSPTAGQYISVPKVVAYYVLTSTTDPEIRIPGNQLLNTHLTEAQLEDFLAKIEAVEELIQQLELE